MWLQHDHPNLAANLFENHTFLPWLQQYWIDVDARTPSEAERYLDDRIDRVRQPVNLFGLSVDQRAILVAGPLAILTASLYLLSLLHIFGIAVERDASLEHPPDAYPWVGLFNDAFSLGLAFVSIVLLAPGASIVLVMRHSYGAGWAGIAAILLSIGLIAVSYFTWQALSRIRSTFLTAKLRGVASDD